jgi:hypothetical protein
MNWEAIGAVGEIVGAIAVVVTIGYLAVQIRQNTRSVRAATHHSGMRGASEIQNTFAQSGDLAQIFHRGMQDYEQLTAEERIRFDGATRSMFMYYEDTFFQFQHSTIDRHLWEARKRGIMTHLGRPGIASWWKRASRHFSEPFVSFTDQLLQQDDEVDRP